jgi:Cu/Ag efflux protein CusF
MKKALLIALTLLVSVAFVTAVFAQPPAGKPAAVAPQKAHASAPEKKPVVERKAPEKKGAKGKTHQYSGDVTTVDTAAKSIVVKSKKDEMSFDVGMARMKGDVKEGDKVTVKYTKKEGKMMASSVTKEAEKKEMKKEVKPGAKPIKPASAK